MSFDDVRLDLRIGFGSSGGPSFSTQVTSYANGREQRNQGWSQPRRRFDAATGLRSAADVAALTAFFYARAGRARAFRLRDWTDYSSSPDGVSAPTPTDQWLGEGDAVSATFQLKKTYTSGGVSFSRAITKPEAASVVIAIDGAPVTTGFTVDAATGLVTLTWPAGLGASVTAGFLFDIPVRFDTDTLSLTADNFGLTHTPVPLIEVRA